VTTIILFDHQIKVVELGSKRMIGGGTVLRKNERWQNSVPPHSALL